MSKTKLSKQQRPDKEGLVFSHVKESSAEHSKEAPSFGFTFTDTAVIEASVHIRLMVPVLLLEFQPSHLHSRQ